MTQCCGPAYIRSGGPVKTEIAGSFVVGNQSRSCCVSLTRLLEKQGCTQA